MSTELANVTRWAQVDGRWTWEQGKPRRDEKLEKAYHFSLLGFAQMGIWVGGKIVKLGVLQSDARLLENLITVGGFLIVAHAGRSAVR